MVDRAIPVFVSYSWTSEEHINKVFDLATRLRLDGIDAKLDKWDLKPGHDKYQFMEQMVVSPEIERVLMICDRAYAEKANARRGGVGNETILITPEVYGKTNQEKFIPLIFGNVDINDPPLPAYLKSTVFIDFSDSADYEESYEQLLRLLYGKPQYQKPNIGKKPKWLETDSSANLAALNGALRRIQNDNGNSKNRTVENGYFLIDTFLETLNQYPVLREDIEDGKIIVDRIDEMKILRDIYLNAFICLLGTDIDIVEFTTTFFERFYNENSSDNTFENEHFQFLLWEIFLFTVAILFKRERFTDLRNILKNTYFIDEKYNPNQHFIYVRFREYFEILEKYYKPYCSEPNLFTLAGNLLTKRVPAHGFTIDDIARVDIILYQLSFIYFPQENGYARGWFPATYIYFTEGRHIWHKLISQKHCLKVLPLFNVSNITELRKVIEQCKPPSNCSYPGAFHSAPKITDDISIEQIGSLDYCSET